MKAPYASKGFCAMTSTAARHCVFYYGTEIPDMKVTRSWTNCHVVLQSYHPLVAEGLFEEFFPGARRYLYWDPTQIPHGEKNALGGMLSDLGHDPRWDTLRLDLRDVSCRRLAVERATALMRVEGVEGLFVDGLDAWAATTAQQEPIVALFEELRASLPREPRWFLNRGFPFWRRLPALEAILLESLWPERFLDSPETELAWMERMLVLHFASLRIRHPNVELYFLRYDDARVEADSDAAESLARRERLISELRQFSHRQLSGNRCLDAWPLEVQGMV
jgi:hypothetical protein